LVYLTKPENPPKENPPIQWEIQDDSLSTQVIRNVLGRRSHYPIKLLVATNIKGIPKQYRVGGRSYSSEEK
jgi:hypothetical protein